MSSPVPARVEFTAPSQPTPQPPSAPAPRRPRRDPEQQRLDRAHARTGRALEQRLKMLGIEPGMVAPTRDRTGHIRLNFRDVERLLKAAEAAR